MAQNKIIFSTYCEDHLQERFGLFKLQRTFAYFNPDQILITYGTNDINKVHNIFGDVSGPGISQTPQVYLDNQIFEQDAASPGNYHAGRAAMARGRAAGVNGGNAQCPTLNV